MKLWIGHIRRDEKKWFIVWANSKEQAINCIEEQSYEPDVKSMLSLDIPGFIHFKVEMVEDKESSQPIFAFGKKYLFLENKIDKLKILAMHMG